LIGVDQLTTRAPTAELVSRKRQNAGKERAMNTQGSGIFDNDAAHEFLEKLRGAAPTAVGDLISGALRGVAQAERPLEVDDVQEALVALALLLGEYDDAVLADAPDAEAVKAWFVDLEVELNPARRQIAGAAITRILLPADNAWYERCNSVEGGKQAIGAVLRLQEELADATGQD